MIFLLLLVAVCHAAYNETEAILAHRMTVIAYCADFNDAGAFEFDCALCAESHPTFVLATSIAGEQTSMTAFVGIELVTNTVYVVFKGSSKRS